MRRSVAAVVALISAPVILIAGSAAALDISFEQVTGAAGGALGIVGGPVGGLFGHVLGRAIGHKIHPPPRPIDLTDMRSRAHVTPIDEPRTLMDSDVAADDRAVDSTPIRMVELRPAEADAHTYLASAPRHSTQARTYLASARHRAPRVRTYLASEPRPAVQADAAAAYAIPVSAKVGDNPTAPPGTLDYQLNQLNAHDGAVRAQTVADVR